MTRAWSVRRASPADKEAICAIERRCATAPHWSDAVWTEVLAGATESELARATFVAEGSSGITGFLVVRCACGVAELESVAVQPEARREGFGRALCMEAMAWSQGRAARIIELEVRASSVDVLALYLSLGFQQKGLRRSYYRDPTEDALLLSTSLV